MISQTEKKIKWTEETKEKKIYNKKLARNNI